MSYGKLYHDFWDDDDKTADPERLSDDGALMAAYLFSGKHRNAIGCFRLGTGAITDVPRFNKWGIDRVSKAIQETIDTGLILRDERTGWTLILNLFKRDPIVGPKVAVHAAKLAFLVPANSVIYKALKERLEPHISEHSAVLEKAKLWPMRSPIDTPSIPHPIPSRIPLPFPEPSPEPEPSSVADARAIASRETSAVENTEALAILKAFDAERVNAFGEARARAWPHPMDLTECQRWVTAGATHALCRPIFAAAMSRMAFAGRDPPDTLSYFEKPVSEAIARASKPMEIPTDDELANTIPAFLDSRKKPASGFDRAVAAARSVVVGE